MKKISLFLSISILTTTISFVPLVSCRKDNYQMSQLTNDIISEMVGDSYKDGICSRPRPSQHCGAINTYLVNRIKQIMSDTDYDVKFDNYHNMYCDIAATQGCEEWQPIILQGHIDMVVAGIDKEKITTTPIIPQIKGRLMHSKGYKTSLGADDGVGLSIMLEIMKNRDQFSHGPIRFIMSSDEEIGLIGAHYLTSDAFKYETNGVSKKINYLLNIDGENISNIYRSCFGTFRERFNQKYTTPSDAPLTNKFELRLDGLKGGHSGVDIVKGRANADRVLFEFINYLVNDEDKDVKIEINKYDHVKNIGGQDADISWSHNQLIQNARVIFYSDASKDFISSQWMNFVESIKSRYPGEDFGSWKMDLNSFGWMEDDPYIDVAETKKLAKLVGSNHNPQQIEDGLPFGVLEWKDDEHTKPKATANIGPIAISDEEGEKETLYFSLKSMYRTSVNGAVTPAPKWSINWAEEKYKQAGSICDIEPQEESHYQPWECKEGINDQMVKFLCNEYEQTGIEYNVLDCDGGIENAEWVTKNPDLICSCIGPTIDGAHSTVETLHIDTVETIYNITVKTIQWMENCPKKTR